MIFAPVRAVALLLAIMISGAAAVAQDNSGCAARAEFYCPYGTQVIGEFPDCECEELAPRGLSCFTDAACPKGTFALGDWPNCYCEEATTVVQSCAANFACSTGLPAFGVWPNCTCFPPESTSTAPPPCACPFGPATGIYPNCGCPDTSTGLAPGIQTCKDMFECPHGYVMRGEPPHCTCFTAIIIEKATHD